MRTRVIQIEVTPLRNCFDVIVSLVANCFEAITNGDLLLWCVYLSRKATVLLLVLGGMSDYLCIWTMVAFV